MSNVGGRGTYEGVKQSLRVSPRAWLVTGAAGFIGSHLVDALLEQGVDVRVLDNLSTGSLRNLQAGAERGMSPGRPGRRIELIIGDVRDDKLARKAMRHVDCVYHLAGLPPGAVAGGHGEVHTVNVQGTLNVLQAAATEGVRRALALYQVVVAKRK